MPLNNSVHLRGWVISPHFKRVPGSKVPQRLQTGMEGSGRLRVPFLHFLIRAVRDETQPGEHPDDTIRVVAYGKLAEQYYPLMSTGTLASVDGWLQYRSDRSVLEVVAQSVMIGQDLSREVGDVAD